MLDMFRSDIARLRIFGTWRSTPRLLLENQCLWACACYRSGNWLQLNRAVVTKDTEGNAVVVGVPARTISYEGSGEYIR